MSVPRRVAPLRAVAVGVAVLGCVPEPDAGDSAARDVPTAEDAGPDTAARDPAAPEEAAARDSVDGADGAAAPGAVQAQGKPVAAFGLSYEVEGVAQLGVPVVLRVSMRPASPVEDVTVLVTADEGLYIDPAESSFSAAAVSASAPGDWTVEITPTREGRHLVRIHAEGRIDGVPQARSVVAAIRVAAVTDRTGLDAAGAAAPDAASSRRAKGEPEGEARPADQGRDGDAEIRMPAVERR